jgi:hypothetical protein
MSARCNLIAEDSYDRIQLCRHWDGYPGRAGGVLAVLEQAIPYAWSFPRFEEEQTDRIDGNRRGSDRTLAAAPTRPPDCAKGSPLRIAPRFCMDRSAILFRYGQTIAPHVEGSCMREKGPSILGKRGGTPFELGQVVGTPGALQALT